MKTFEIKSAKENEIVFKDNSRLLFKPEWAGSAKVSFEDIPIKEFNKKRVKGIEVTPTDKGFLVNGFFVRGFDLERVVMRPECNIKHLKNGENKDIFEFTKNDILKFEYIQVYDL